MVVAHGHRTSPSGGWTTLLGPLGAPAEVSRNAVILRRPGAAVAAAVLAVGCAALLLGMVVALLVHVLTAGPGAAGGRWSAALGAFATCALAGLGMLGALALLRGTGRALLLTVAWVQVGLLGVTLAAVVTHLIGGATTPGTAAVVMAGCAVGLVLAGTSVRLGQRPAVGAWVETARSWRSLEPDGRPVRPVALVLLTVTLVALSTAGAAVAAPQGTAAHRPVGTEVGPAVPPPVVGDPGWSAEFAPDAAACSAGAMTACDDLYWSGPVGEAYERYGSTCGGRLAREVAGGCLALLGATLN